MLRIGPIHTHTTSLISGALFIGIGVLFLLTAGTANLGGFLSAETSVALQGWLARVAGNVNNLVVALAVILVVIGVLIRRIRRVANPLTENKSTRGGENISAAPLHEDGSSGTGHPRIPAQTPP